nr:hypothetical protein BaRGS_004407 [Batillaria attramentaria]
MCVRCKKNCPVRGQPRIACGYCRFQRCLALGMSRHNIKIGRYTDTMRAHNTKELRMLQTRETNIDLPDEEVDAILRDLMHAAKTSLFSADDYSPEEILRKQKECLREYLAEKERLGTVENAPQEQCGASSGMNVKQRVDRHASEVDRCVRRYIRFGKGVPGFKELSLDDQADLLKTSRMEIWFLGAYPGYNNELEVAHLPNGRCVHYSEPARVVGMDHLRKIGDLGTRLKRYSFTPEEMVVIKAICLTSTDRSPLQQPEKVEEIQWLMVRCLLRLFERRCPGKSGKLLSDAVEALRGAGEWVGEGNTVTIVVLCNKTCPIRGQRRISCAYCRYQRCLALGMSRQNIKIGRYTSTMRAHNCHELHVLRNRQTRFDLTDQEVDAILQDLVHAGKTSLFSADDYSPEEILRRQRECLQKYLAERELRGPIENIPPEVSMLGDNAGVPGFKELSLDDQADLLKTARMEIWFLAAYPGYNNELEVVHFPNGRCAHYSELAWVLGMCHVRTLGELATRLKRYTFTQEEMVVIKAICLTSQDRSPLQQPEKIEEIQWLMVRCLLRLFERRCPGKSGKLLSDAVEALRVCRIVKELSDNVQKVDILKAVYSKHKLLEEVILMCP